MVRLFISLTILQIISCTTPPLAFDWNELVSMIPLVDYFLPAPSVPAILSSEGNEETAKWLYPYASTSYCNSDQINSWNCPVCNDENKLEKIQYIQNNDQNLSGFIGYRDGKIVISFKGIDGFASLAKEFNPTTVDMQLNNGQTAQVHSEFYSACQSIISNVVSSLETVKNEYPDASVYLTGHSLGGAVALLASIELESRGIVGWDKLNVYTFGQPRVGDQVFADFLNSRSGATFLRITNKFDMIPSLPPRLLSYTHHQYIALYEDNKRQECSKAEEEEKCFAFYSVFQIEQHGQYFGSKLSDNCAKSDLDLFIHGLSVVGNIAEEVGLSDFVYARIGMSLI
jgi:hypothetical protein